MFNVRDFIQEILVTLFKKTSMRKIVQKPKSSYVVNCSRAEYEEISNSMVCKASLSSFPNDTFNLRLKKTSLFQFGF